jgi:putative peptidoglycan lipid II flippase
MFMPVGVIAQAAAVAAYPYLARMFAEGKVAAMAATVNRALKYVIVLSMAASGILAALSWEAIRILFQHGSFEAADTGPAASALFFYALAIPIWGALQILTRAFYATKDMWTPVIVGTIATVAALPAYWGLQRAFGIEGVALASVLALGLYTAALAFLWYRTPERRGGFASVMETVARAVPLAVGGALAAWAVAWAVGSALGDGFAGATAGAVAGVAVFGAVAIGSAVGLYESLSRRTARLNRTEDPEAPANAER